MGWGEPSEGHDCSLGAGIGFARRVELASFGVPGPSARPAPATAPMRRTKPPSMCAQSRAKPSRTGPHRCEPEADKGGFGFARRRELASLGAGDWLRSAPACRPEPRRSHVPEGCAGSPGVGRPATMRRVAPTHLPSTHPGQRDISKARFDPMQVRDSLSRGLVLSAAMSLLAIGCGTSGTSRDVPDETTPKAGSGTQAKAPAKASTAKAKSSSRVLGDRMANLAPMAPKLDLPQDPSPFRFAEIAREAGIDFVHVSGMDRRRSTSRPPTARASPSSTTTATASSTSTSPPAPTCPSARGRPARTGSTRTSAAASSRTSPRQSGLGFEGFCHGIIVGDIDNDGDPDVFLCNYGPNVLYLNNGDGTFTDISKKAGIDRDGWSSGGALIDYRQRRRPRHLRRQLRRLEAPRRRPVSAATRSRGIRTLLLAPRRSGPSSTSSTGTTATARSPTSTTRSSSTRPRRPSAGATTATASAWSRPTSTATARSTSTSPTT